MTRRVLLVVVAVTTLAVVAFSIPAAVAIRNSQRREGLLELQREASIVASRVSATGTIDSGLLQPIADPDHKLALYDPSGRLIGGTGPSEADGIVELALDGNFVEGRIDGDVVAAVPVRVGSFGATYAVRIEASSSDSIGRYARSVGELAVAGVIVIAAAALVGLWLARRLNRPVDELRRWASSDDLESFGDDDPPSETGIAELDALRQALIDDRSRIAELLRRERSFSSQVSHQLRTPVAAMRVAIETELAAPRPDREAVLTETLGQLDRLESTIRSLLQLARHGARSIESVDLRAAADDGVLRWRSAAGRLERALVVGATTVTARTDADVVGHVIDVLVENALRHGRGTVTLRAYADGGVAVLDVVDGGQSPLDNDVFADTGADAPHGIGLRLARSLTESVDGRLELDRAAATTTFRLSLPLAP